MTARTLFEKVWDAHVVAQSPGGLRFEPFVVVTLIITATEFFPVVLHNRSHRFACLRQDRDPAKDRPQAVLFAHVI